LLTSCSPSEDFDSSAIPSLAIISSYYTIILLKFFLLILYESSETDFFCVILTRSSFFLEYDDLDLLVLEDEGENCWLLKVSLLSLCSLWTDMLLSATALLLEISGDAGASTLP
jgi:hypothetical protein